MHIPPSSVLTLRHSQNKPKIKYSSFPVNSFISQVLTLSPLPSELVSQRRTEGPRDGGSFLGGVLASAKEVSGQAANLYTLTSDL